MTGHDVGVNRNLNLDNTVGLKGKIQKPEQPLRHTQADRATHFLIWMRLLFAGISHSWVVGRSGGGGA